MKKIYINPQIEVLTIPAQQMLAGSIGKGDGQVGAGESDARFSNDDWDDEEDEEDYSPWKR